MRNERYVAPLVAGLARAAPAASTTSATASASGGSATGSGGAPGGSGGILPAKKVADEAGQSVASTVDALRTIPDSAYTLEELDVVIDRFSIGLE